MKRSSKGFLFENHENRTWHRKPTFYKSSALGPSKNGPGERFWKNMKTLWKHIGISMVFYGPQTIGNIGKQTLFLIWGRTKKDETTMSKIISKVILGGQQLRHWRPMPDLSSDLYHFSAMSEKHVFSTLVPKIRKFGPMVVSGRVCREGNTTFGSFGKRCKERRGMTESAPYSLL